MRDCAVANARAPQLLMSYVAALEPLPNLGSSLGLVMRSRVTACSQSVQGQQISARANGERGVERVASVRIIRTSEIDVFVKMVVIAI